MLRPLRIWSIRLLALALVTVLLLAAAWLWITTSTNSAIYADIDAIPVSTEQQTRAGLVLGTSPWTLSGHTNGYFVARMNKAAELYLSGKIDKLIVSGDNRQKEYNEPVEMRDALVKKGVPVDDIVLDYAGFRTLDSVVRAKTVFAAPEIIIVSQRWHNQRALYIARQHDLPAIAVNANDPSWRSGYRTRLREVLAKIWMLIDVHLLDREPYYPGPPAPIFTDHELN